jgi:predicted nuclease with RNAse H fold
MIRNDAPLSVQRGFRREDLELLRANPNLRGFSYNWRPLFRYLITLSGTASPIHTNVTLES